MYGKLRRKMVKIVQVDASILITANVPSAKKIVVHGPEVSFINHYNNLSPFSSFFYSNIPPVDLGHILSLNNFLILLKGCYTYSFTEF